MNDSGKSRSTAPSGHVEQGLTSLVASIVAVLESPRYRILVRVKPPS
jgi:hypothetical protein